MKLVKKTHVRTFMENAELIMTHSNATIFKTKTDFGFNCALCTKIEKTPQLLKLHVLQRHKPKELLTKYNGKTTQYAFYLKFDITNLKCKLCEEGFSDLEVFVNHLKVQHAIEFAGKLEESLVIYVPFVFKEGSKCYTCALCSYENLTFLGMKWHTLSHKKNYSCELCDKTYITKRGYDSHKYKAHVGGKHECAFCYRRFLTHSGKESHEREVHYGVVKKKSKCGICGERFGDYAAKHTHLFVEHDKEQAMIECKACEKLFLNQRSLRDHQRRTHMLERKTPKVKIVEKKGSNSD